MGGFDNELLIIIWFVNYYDFDLYFLDLDLKLGWVWIFCKYLGIYIDVVFCLLR